MSQIPQRFIVWLTGAILGFQAVTLAAGLVGCTVLTWTYLNRNAWTVEDSIAERGRKTQRQGAEVVSNAICEDPQRRVDEAVGKALGIVAGLAMGGVLGTKAGRDSAQKVEDEEDGASGEG